MHGEASEFNVKHRLPTAGERLELQYETLDDVEKNQAECSVVYNVTSRILISFSRTHDFFIDGHNVTADLFLGGYHGNKAKHQNSSFLKHFMAQFDKNK